MKPADVACLGETMAQVLPIAGALVDAELFRVQAAGAESNVARALVRLGRSAAWVSRLGADPLGDRVLAELADAGVDVTGVQQRSGQTGVYFKDPSASGSRIFYYRSRSVAREMDTSDVDLALGMRPAILHLSGITPALSASCARAVDYALSVSREHGVATSFDVNHRPALWPADVAGPALASLARRADIVFVGRDEAERLWGTRTAGAIRELLPQPRHLVVKDADIEAVEFSSAGVVVESAETVDVVEPVGAGDAFAAGWLHGMLLGLDAGPRLRLAHRVASAALTSLTDSFAVSDLTGFHDAPRRQSPTAGEQR